METKYDNYIWDCYIKSFENAEALLEDSNSIAKTKKKCLLNLTDDKYKIWKNLYDTREKFLLNNVCIKVAGKVFKIDLVSFHPKYGWIVSYKSHKAYLGKSSIYGSLKLLIGENTYFSGHSILRGKGNLEIGSYCSIAFNQYINVSNLNHPIDFAASIGIYSEVRLVNNFGLSKPELNIEDEKVHSIIIGNDVWVGHNSSIFPNVCVGNGSVIGAHSLVTKDCEPYGIYVGKPAKLIRKRFSNSIIQELLELEWWNWTEEKIKNNTIFFKTNLTTYKGSIFNLIIE